ncbi:MAG TPA: hydrogenase maturation protease [Acidobacteriota bacterium]|nr:hydrogenase maturation protease [Acidobacteriota bacterium]
MISPDYPHPPSPVRARLLVLGYGNTLFGDDGLGQLIAQHVADWAVPGVLALARHELTPELAADVAMADEVIFVDAALHTDGVVFVPVNAASPDRAGLNHALTPTALLALARAAFGRSPERAWQLLVPARDFTLGNALSDVARDGLSRALAGIAHRM